MRPRSCSKHETRVVHRPPIPLLAAGARFLSLITLIAIGGVFVGVMALIVVTSVMTGLQRDLRDKILGTNPHIWVTTYGEGMQIPDWPETLARVRACPAWRPRRRSSTPRWRWQPGRYAEARSCAASTRPRGPPITDIVRQIRRGASAWDRRSPAPPLLVGDALANRFGSTPAPW
jgi:ABC-type lipoprotein release transport system permease subunit